MRPAALLLFPLAGALLAGGAIAVARTFGPDAARELGAEAGAGFAQGVARMQSAAEALTVSGERGHYRGGRGHGRG